MKDDTLSKLKNLESFLLEKVHEQGHMLGVEMERGDESYKVVRDKLYQLFPELKPSSNMKTYKIVL